jgi:hypothetical protein
MASDKPPVSRESVEHEDQSIKVRKSQLFEPTAQGPAEVRPFEEFLRSTPPTPLSPGVKAALWVVGAIVALLFLAALLSVGRSTRPRGRADRAPDSRAERLCARHRAFGTSEPVATGGGWSRLPLI